MNLRHLKTQVCRPCLRPDLFPSCPSRFDWCSKMQSVAGQGPPQGLPAPLWGKEALRSWTRTDRHRSLFTPDGWRMATPNPFLSHRWLYRKDAIYPTHWQISTIDSLIRPGWEIEKYSSNRRRILFGQCRFLFSVSKDAGWLVRTPTGMIKHWFWPPVIYVYIYRDSASNRSVDRRKQFPHAVLVFFWLYKFCWPSWLIPWDIKWKQSV